MKMRLFFALVCLTSVAYAQSSAPSITGATPATVDAGGEPFTLTVNVSAFIPGAVVRWAGIALTTTYVNDTTLSATVPANLTAICGKYLLTVTSPQSTTATGSFPYIVKPVLTSISPNIVAAGTNGAGMTAVGLGFSSNVYLTLIASGKTTNLQTGYTGSTTTLTAFVPASALDGVFPTASLFVTDPTTGAVSQTLAITLTFASVTAISPNRIQAGIDTFTLLVGGSNFVPGAVVLFQGSTLVTKYGSANILSATVPAALVHDEVPGGIGIQVKNPGTAPTNSIKLVIDPNPFGTQLISLSPDHAVAGGPSVTVTATGERFVPSSIANWVRTPLPTTFVSSTQLTFTVPVDLVAIEGVAPITIVTPGLANSNSLSFPVVRVSPTISNRGDGISPASAVAGGPAFTLTVNGDGFVLASQVTGLAGATTTYVSLNQLKVNVPASAIVNPGQYPLRVQNPGPVLSPQAPIFTVTTVAPSITGLNPSTAIAGGPAFTLTLTGSSFVPAAKVYWNGDVLATTSGTTTQLTAQVPATLIATAGTAKITVSNDGTAFSNELPLPIASTLVPSLSSLSPSSTMPGAQPFTLTVNGAGFTSNTTVQWNGTTIPSKFVNAAQLTASVTASLVAAAGTANVSVTSENGASGALVFSIVPAPPATTSAGVVNAASSLPAIAPGALIAIYGTNLAGGLAQADKTPLPTTLDGTSVTIDGAKIPLLFVSSGQVNAQVPYETKPGTVKLAVQAGSGNSAPVDIQVAATGPGVFSPLQSNHVLALNLADATLNSAQSPAKVGQYVTAYLTGQGAVNPAAPTGDVAPSDPLSLPVAAVQVKIGGKLATLQFAGLAPGFVGLMQMNILIPDVPAGELPFEVSVGGVSAASTVISVGANR
ncbi:MAG: IPT/TIG domain-containing protein [Candidatus Solibacter sp.]